MSRITQRGGVSWVGGMQVMVHHWNMEVNHYIMGKNACGGDLVLGGATDSAREKILMKTPARGRFSFGFGRGYRFRARENKNALNNLTVTEIITRRKVMGNPPPA